MRRGGGPTRSRPPPHNPYTQLVVAVGTTMVIGVARLARPEFLIEVDAIAVK
jgi:enamine deaminase RidA (YjgF/YER057c/UK114 family)